MQALFNRFIITLTKRQAESISGAGEQEENVKWLLNVPAIKRQLNRINANDIRAELKEYGAWDSNELQDSNQNLQRILWIAGGNIKDIMNKNPRKRMKKNPANKSGIRIVYNKMLGGWYLVRGPHQTPLNGRFDTKQQAQEWLERKRAKKNPRKRKTKPFAGKRKKYGGKYNSHMFVSRGKVLRRPRKRNSEFVVSTLHKGAWKRIAGFPNREKAIQYAKAIHRAYTGRQVRVTK